MKKFLAVAALSIITVTNSHAVFQAFGVAQCNLTVVTQAQDLTLTSSKTNITATSTNTMLILKASVKKAPFDGSDFLALIENSFKTNFPSGSQIGMSGSSIVIVDSTGTNLVFNPNSVISVVSGVQLVSGLITEISIQNKNGPSESGNLTEDRTIDATLNYDDSLLTTHDGTHSQFQFRCQLTLDESENFKTGSFKFSTELEGIGGGTLRNVPILISGTIKAKAQRAGSQVK